jgi:hypothetical protein
MIVELLLNIGGSPRILCNCRNWKSLCIVISIRASLSLFFSIYPGLLPFSQEARLVLCLFSKLTTRNIIMGDDVQVGGVTNSQISDYLFHTINISNIISVKDLQNFH